jgi:type III restriction enzyme
MILKAYQLDALAALKRFFEDCRAVGAAAAFDRATSGPEAAARLGALRGGYVQWATMPNAPRVCLKVPTGGGKTIMATHAAKIVGDTWCERENPVVLWFCPSDTIRAQTCEALKNPRHPYRMSLDEQFGWRARVFDIDEKFNVRPADVEGGACVIVSTIQAFRQSDTGKYNVYRHNENMEPHFARMAAPAPGMELDPRGRPKLSFANLLYHHRPIVIVDEAHNVISDLSQETLARLNPAAIVELTATPRPNNNTLYSVRAAELKEEEMIKLPIELREHLDWERAVDEAILKRAELEKAAEGERDYVRPVLLLQARHAGGEAGVAELREYLAGTANIPAREIAVATGDQKDLDGVDIFARDCPVKYVITVEALKEGWDCSFAYVLCSLANVKSEASVEQLLGRVMRMPYARARRAPALNRAYAYVLSPAFGEAAGALVRKLMARGFDDAEAASAIEHGPSELPGLFGRGEANKVDLERPLAAADLPATIGTENGGRTIVLSGETTEADVAALAKRVSGAEFIEIQYKFSGIRRAAAPSPAGSGARFTAPRMMVELQGEWLFPDPDRIFEEYDWDIAKLISPRLEAREFAIEPQGDGFVIDLDGNRLCYSPSGDQPQLQMADVEGWTATNLVAWLDRRLRQVDVPQSAMLEWLRQAVEHLTDGRGIGLSQLMLAKYALANRMEAKIDAARREARGMAFQTALFAREARVMLNFDDGFEFSASMYDDQAVHCGAYRFQKHYLGASRVPLIDGGEAGEEFACAKAIDALPQVKYWLRNVARHSRSFWLPTSTDRFYPDFIALLDDGRTLVVEYKGAHLADGRDAKEKRMIGELWEKHAAGRGLFLMAVKNADGLDARGQIMKKMGAA